MKINSDIFKAYDIRGIYPSEINEETAYLIGQAFPKFLNKKKPKIIVGRDNRFSSETLFNNLASGLIEKGANVINIGLSTTPMLYWACAYYNFDGGIMITASHLEKEFNGFKIVKEKAIPVSEKSGLKKIKSIIKKNKKTSSLSKKGKIIKKEILKDYLRFNLKNFNFNQAKSLKIIIDTANAVPGILIPELKKLLPIEIYPIFNELDGNFPNHSPNPLIEESLDFLKKELINKKAAFGAAFDGDGDRIVFLDEKGKIISGDLITALLASLILKENPGQKILCDIRSSNIVKDVVKNNGGEIVISRIGHSFIKKIMREKNIFFGGEFSGHYYLKNHYFSEAPLFVLLKILETISQTKTTLSSLIKPFKKYFHSGEINFVIKNKKEALKALENKFSEGNKLKIDGLRVDFKDWWFLVRPSATENILRLVIEAKTKKLMDDKIKELSSLIKKVELNPSSF